MKEIIVCFVIKPNIISKLNIQENEGKNKWKVNINYYEHLGWMSFDRE